MFVYDKRKKEILEIEEAYQDKLQLSKWREKMRKYDIITNDMGHFYKSSDKIILMYRHRTGY